MLADFSDYAMAFQAFVSMYGLYVEERRADKELDAKKFADWLEEHRFGQLKKLLTENQELQAGIAKLLRADHAEILGQLRDMDKLMAGIAGKMDGFKEISQAVGLAPEISDQADSLLTQLYQSGAQAIFISENSNASVCMLSDQRRLAFTEPRVVGDDLRTLEFYGFLHGTPDANGYDYSITRAGIRYLTMKGIKPEASQSPTELPPQ